MKQFSVSRSYLHESREQHQRKGGTRRSQVDGAQTGMGQGAAEVGGEGPDTRTCFVRVIIINRVQRSVKFSVRRPVLWGCAAKQHLTSHR